MATSGERSTRPPRATRRRFGDRVVVACSVAAVALVVLAAGAAPWDVSLARGVAAADLPSDLVRAIHFSEVFAHGTGVAAILLAVVVIDRAGRNRVVIPLAGAAAGGLSADVVKLLIERVRPRAADLHDLSLAAADTFGDWLPLGAGGSDLQSFPSAHAATAAGLAVGLSRLYPHAAPLFASLAAAAGLQRVVASAHFPSDVFVGAAVGLAAGAWAAAAAERFVKRRTVAPAVQDEEAPNRRRSA